jgi:hypothetical protein
MSVGERSDFYRFDQEQFKSQNGVKTQAEIMWLLYLE